jgi:hypothetical protein
MLSVARAAEARDKGMQLLFPKFECEAARGLITSIASRQAELTSDDLWREMEAAGIGAMFQPNALGAAFRAAAVNGHIESTGRVVKSARVSAHRRNVLVWRSLIYQGGRA